MIKIQKAHWECWASCNLHCDFCYRMIEEPLDTKKARVLIDELSNAGITEMVFAGGDPSIRPDIGELIRYAKSRGLKTEVQTNAHVFGRVFDNLFQFVDLFGFSLDSGDSQIHDAVRGTSGNYDRVLAAIEACENLDQPFVVRTMVSEQTYESIRPISNILRGKRNLRKWSLVEFSPVGAGFLTKEKHQLAGDNFLSIAQSIASTFDGNVDIYANDDKGGVYFLIKPNGDVYTTVRNFQGEIYNSVGNIILDGVDTCLARIDVNSTAHRKRYEGLI